MKLSIKSCIAGLFALCATAASAIPADGGGGRWIWSYERGADVAAINYQGQQLTYEFAYGTSESNLFNSVRAARNNLFYTLRSQYEAGVAAAVVGQDGYRSHSTWVNGPIQFAITPTPGSTHPTVSLSQLSAGLQMNFKKRTLGGLISVSCDVWLNSGPLNLSGRLDVTSGLIYDLRINNFQPSYGKDCDSSVSWVPIIGNIVEDIANDKVDSLLKRAIDQAIVASQSTFKPIQFAGLNVGIPDGKYVFNGFDAGQYVRANLGQLIATANVTVRFDTPPPPGAGSGGIAYDGGQKVYDAGVLWINFGNQNLTLGLVERTYFNAVWYCPWGQVCPMP